MHFILEGLDDLCHLEEDIDLPSEESLDLSLSAQLNVDRTLAAPLSWAGR
jgi:hypothetical protein